MRASPSCLRTTKRLGTNGSRGRCRSNHRRRCESPTFAKSAFEASWQAGRRTQMSITQGGEPVARRRRTLTIGFVFRMQRFVARVGDERNAAR